MATTPNILTTTVAISGSVKNNPYVSFPSATSSTVYSPYVTSNIFNNYTTVSPHIMQTQPSAEDDIGKFIEAMNSAGIVVSYFNISSDNIEDFNLCIRLTMKRSVISKMNKAALRTGTLLDINIIHNHGGFSDGETLEVTMNIAIGKSPTLFDGDSLMKFIFDVFPRIGEESIINKMENI